MFLVVSFNSFLLGRRKLQFKKKKAKLLYEDNQDSDEEQPPKRRSGNFLMFYETVDEWQEIDSQLTAQVADILSTYHNKQSFTLIIPDCFHELDEWYPDMKRVISDEQLTPLRLVYSHNVMTSSVGIIFVHTRVKDLLYESVDERAMKQYLLLKFILGFKKLEVIIDPTKQQMIEAIEQLKESATDLAKGSSKDKKKLVICAIVNVGFFLNLDYQPHIDLVADHNREI